VRAALEDFASAPLAPGLRATLAFLEKLTLDPAAVDEHDVQAVIDAGVTPRALRDAIEVAAAFNTIDRIADALDFEPQSEGSLRASAHTLTTRGYA
jgi:alkylhydroperoxidase family enzyme